MSSKRRRQTRRLKIDTPYDRQPWVHNETVALVRMLQRIGKAARIASRRFSSMAEAVRGIEAALNAYNQRGRK